MDNVALLKTLPVNNILGECVLWNDVDRAFYWTDIHDKKLYRYHPGTDMLQQWETPERLCSFGFVDGDNNTLIAAFESGIALYRLHTGEVDWLDKPETGITGIRFNDGRVDRQGRFWSGSIVEADRALDEQGNEVDASVYRVTCGDVARMQTGLRNTNSLCWNLDSTKQFLADSPTHTIRVYDFDADTGTPTNGRPFVKTGDNEVPDGACIDAEDHLWNARFGGGKVVRHRPDGDVDIEINLPVTQPTCVCFGGHDLSLLAVTSATEDLSNSERAVQPSAGALFIFETAYKGLPESRYRKT